MALATLLEHAVPTATDWIGSRPRLGDRHPETAESPLLPREGPIGCHRGTDVVGLRTMSVRSSSNLRSPSSLSQIDGERTSVPGSRTAPGHGMLSVTIGGR
jgi:hypothetical protein